MQVDLTQRDLAQLRAALLNWQVDALNEDLADIFAEHLAGPVMDDAELADLCRRLQGDAY